MGDQAISQHPTPCPGSGGPFISLSLSPTLGCSPPLFIPWRWLPAPLPCWPPYATLVALSSEIHPCRILPPPIGAGCVRAHLISAHQGREVHRLRALCPLPQPSPRGDRSGGECQGCGNGQWCLCQQPARRCWVRTGCPLCPRVWVSTVPGRKALPDVKSSSNLSAMATSFSRSTCRKGPAPASPVAPPASALGLRGAGCPDPGEGLPILGTAVLGSPAVAPSRWRPPSLLSLWDAVQLHLRILYSCLLARGVLLFFLDLLA